MNQIIYWTFNIWLNIPLFSLKHRRDGSSRHQVAPGNPCLDISFQIWWTLIRSSRKVVWGFWLSYLIAWAKIGSIRFISGLLGGYWIAWISWSSNHCVIAASLWAIVKWDPLYQAIFKISPWPLTCLWLKVSGVVHTLRIAQCKKTGWTHDSIWAR